MKKTVTTYKATLTLMSGTTVEISDSGQSAAAKSAVLRHDAVTVTTDSNVCIYPYHAIASICIESTSEEKEITDDTCKE